MQSRLIWKILGINILVIGVVILIVWLAIDYLAADYFMVLMKQYNISPTTAHHMFLAAAHRYLVWASLAALALAALLSFLLTHKVLTPLSQMLRIIQKIAAGDYTVRIDIISKDEVGQLATAFNRMAESLQRIEQLRKSMVVDVAHELRTPLTNIRGYLEALHDGVIALSQAPIKSLLEETLRLGELVESLLQLARADTARTTLELQGLSLQKFIDHTLDIFRPQLVAKGITVKTQVAASADMARADPGKLAQVVHNLFQNACQYTPPNGHVQCRTERLPAEIKLTLTNTHEGIAPAHLPFIFERFYRAEKSRSREHGGAGIGLTIVKELIAAHGGRVGAKTSATKIHIWFTLPV
ncbi:Adaptive-response sensory-kinase SasA [Candidatus Entotheonellaceae bacterium PAL068K]